MSLKQPRNAHLSREKGRRRQPRQNNAVLCALVGIVFGGLFLLMFNQNQEKDKRVRRPVAKVEIEKGKIPAESHAAQDTSEKTTPVAPVPPPQPAEVDDNDAPARLAVANDNPSKTTPDVPGKSTPVTPNPPVVPPTLPHEEAPCKDDRLTATNSCGERYIDMTTGTLLFTEDSSQNDENLEVYLEHVMDTYETEDYDQQGAERKDENKKVR